MKSAFAISVMIGLTTLGATRADASPPDETTAICRPGPPRTGGPSSLRPDATALCAYDVSELYRRLGALFATEGRVYSVELAQATFGIPPMTTAYDSETDANYTTLLEGEGGWKMSLWVRESAPAGRP